VGVAVRHCVREPRFEPLDALPKRILGGGQAAVLSTGLPVATFAVGTALVFRWRGWHVVLVS
jgi:hypothetical protein